MADSIRDAATNAYRHLRDRQGQYNPITEEVFNRLMVPPPTTSPLLAVTQGLLSGYLANKLGESKMAYAEGTRQREKAEERQEYDRRRASEQKDRIGLMGTEHALKFSAGLRDPEKFQPMTPAQQGNVDTITSLLATNPEFQRATADDPSFGSSAIRSTVSPNPSLGILGLQPSGEFGTFGKDSSGIFNKRTGGVATPPSATFDYKDRARNTPEGTQVQEYSLDGGKTWQPMGDAAPRWSPGEGGKSTPGGPIKTDLQRFAYDAMGQYFERSVMDQMGNTVKMIPPEMRDAHMKASGRLLQIIQDNPSIDVATAQSLVLDEFRRQGYMPTDPTGRLIPMSVLGLHDDPSGQMGPGRDGVSWFAPPGGAPFSPAPQQPAVSPVAPQTPTSTPEQTQNPFERMGGVLGSIMPSLPGIPTAPQDPHRPRLPSSGQSRGGGLLGLSADPMIAPTLVGPGVWQYQVDGKTYNVRGEEPGPMRRSQLTGKKQPSVSVMP